MNQVTENPKLLEGDCAVLADLCEMAAEQAIERGDDDDAKLYRAIFDRLTPNNR